MRKLHTNLYAVNKFKHFQAIIDQLNERCLRTSNNPLVHILANKTINHTNVCSYIFNISNFLCLSSINNSNCSFSVCTTGQWGPLAASQWHNTTQHFNTSTVLHPHFTNPIALIVISNCQHNINDLFYMLVMSFYVHARSVLACLVVVLFISKALNPTPSVLGLVDD